MNNINIDNIVNNQKIREKEFPICKNKVFMAHAGVCNLPARTSLFMSQYLQDSTKAHQEEGDIIDIIYNTRQDFANLLNAKSSEIALLGPTSLGLSLVANGLNFKKNDEIICYQDDYPANVYPWLNLQDKGVKIKYLKPNNIGEITPNLIKESISENTRLVALASCNFLSGYRIDIEGIGKILHENNILFSVDAIQTLGAFAMDVKYVDFLSADSHKWLLGPMASGIFYVKEKHFDILKPTLHGAWNVNSPNFITQDQIKYANSARRYEPGALNIAGILGMKKSLELLSQMSITKISKQLLILRTKLIDLMKIFEFDLITDEKIFSNSELNASGIVTFTHKKLNLSELFKTLNKNNINVSLRFDRENKSY